jgi:endonuclease/exonuclease/phosphatase family metal-dependent hydrolase
MKLITLNMWGGRIEQPLLRFFKKNKDIDLFCLQEVYHKAEPSISIDNEDRLNIFDDIQAILKDHTGYFCEVLPGYGLAFFIKKQFPVILEGVERIHTNDEYVSGGAHSRNLQHLTFSDGSREITVVNVHGLWNGQGKTDTDARLAQSKAIRNFTDSVSGLKIICGDFNLRPDTESIAIIEQGMHNLIKENNILSTRTSLYGKDEKYADYIFTSPEIDVKDFKVMPEEVSDHAALYLECEI